MQEEIALVGFGSDKKSIVTGVEMFRKLLDDGQAGDNAACGGTGCGNQGAMQRHLGHGLFHCLT